MVNRINNNRLPAFNIGPCQIKSSLLDSSNHVSPNFKGLIVSLVMKANTSEHNNYEVLKRFMSKKDISNYQLDKLCEFICNR